MSSEANIEKKLRDLVKSCGGWCLKLLSTHVTGLPDRLCLLPGGRVVFVELKAKGKKPRKIQLKQHERLRNLGFRVEVIDSIQQLETFINSIQL